MKRISQLLFFFLSIAGMIPAQETADDHLIKDIHKIYVDVAGGGLIIPGEGAGINGHVGIGYQLSTVQGVGVGASYSTNVDDFNIKGFSGIGLEYRVNYQLLFFKNTLGFSIKEDIDGADGYLQYKRIGGQKYLFYRGAVGYKSPKGFFNIGLVINIMRGRFNQFNCSFDVLDDCRFAGAIPQGIISPQIYFGLSFPKIK